MREEVTDETGNFCKNEKNQNNETHCIEEQN